MSEPRPYCYEYPRPAVTVDMVVFALDGTALRALMVRRKRDPFAGAWAVPGGFLELDEPAEAAARRELREETGLAAVGHVEPIGFFAAPGRDPRGRTISLAFAGVVRWPAPRVRGADDAAEAAWLEPGRIDAFAFDHAEVLAVARRWLAAGVATGPLGPALLPLPFGDQHVRALLRAALGSARRAAAWRRRQERAGRVVPVPGSAAEFRPVEP
jgi:8-oxo-dGTP diphosphatase